MRFHDYVLNNYIIRLNKWPTSLKKFIIVLISGKSYPFLLSLLKTTCKITTPGGQPTSSSNVSLASYWQLMPICHIGDGPGQ